MALALVHDVGSVDIRDADKLRAMAASLVTRADSLREEYLDTLRESRQLEQEAARIEEAARATPAPAATNGRGGENDTDVMARVCDALEHGPMSSGALADHVGISQPRARAALTRLEAIGMVARTGVKSATLYRLTADSEATPAPEHGHVSYERVIRDAVVKLDTFDLAALAAELPDISEHTLRQWVLRFERKGMLESERDGKRKVYAYVKRAAGPTPARQRHATPEEIARRTAGPAPRRGGVVAGTGRARVGSPVVDALIREAAEFGVTVTTSKHRVEYRKDGRIVATSSKTPGASHLGGTRKALRDAGVPVAP